ncbi:energy transducer TonB [Leptospira sp. WS39.C2]
MLPFGNLSRIKIFIGTPKLSLYLKRLNSNRIMKKILYYTSILFLVSCFNISRISKKQTTPLNKEEMFDLIFFNSCLESNLFESKDKEKKPCLANAIRNNQKEFINYLLKKNININIEDKNKLDPYYYSAFFGDLKLMETLEKLGANTKKKYKNQTAKQIYDTKYLPKDDEPYIGIKSEDIIKPFPEIHLDLEDAYPIEFRDLMPKKTVLLKLKIFKNGRVDSIEVISNEIEEPYIREALRVISRTTFSPATLKGKPINAELIQSISFE